MVENTQIAQSAFEENLSSAVLFMALKNMRHSQVLSVSPASVSQWGSQQSIQVSLPGEPGFAYLSAVDWATQSHSYTKAAAGAFLPGWHQNKRHMLNVLNVKMLNVLFLQNHPCLHCSFSQIDVASFFLSQHRGFALALED